MYSSPTMSADSPQDAKPKKVQEIHEPSPAEQAPEEKKEEGAKPRRMTLTLEEADKLGDLVNQMRNKL